jgi:hypothetical protein
MEPSPSPLSDETQRAIEELAQEIAGANDLDSEIGAELRGHIEDKVAGYLSGEVRPSERDAMLLARAHFGDPAMVSVFLARVHGRPVGMTLFRQLAALGLVTRWIRWGWRFPDGRTCTTAWGACLIFICSFC